MTSPIVRRLLASIEESKEPETRACYIAELACYWARIGEFSRADELRAELRRGFGDGRSVRVSILIMCIEALLMYFRELSPLARDRMSRASLLSKAARDGQLIALTSAWMAHIDFNLNQFESMASAMSACLSAIGSDDGAANCRVSLVLGDAFLFVGDLAPSNAWYGRAHSAAGMTGDQAAIGALTYNRAALHVARARFQHLSTPLATSEVDLLRAEVQSAINYQAIAQLRSLEHLLQTANIGALMLQDRLDEALPLIKEVLTSSEVPEGSAQRILLLADMALGLASTGKTAAALQVIDSLPRLTIDSFSPDDRALIWASISRASHICGAEDHLPRYTSEISDAIVKHSDILARLAKLLTPFERVPSLA